LDFCTFRVTVKRFVLRKLLEVQREFIRTQHLHVVASSIAKLPDDVLFRLRRPTHAPWLILSACLWNRTR